MRSTKPDLVDQTIHLWRHRTGEVISREDAKEMMNNIAGFFQVLSDWNSKIHDEDTQADESTSFHAVRRMRGAKRIR